MALIYNVFLPLSTYEDSTLKIVEDGIERTLPVSPQSNKYTVTFAKGSSVTLSVEEDDSISFFANGSIVPSSPEKISVKFVGETEDVPPPAPVVDETPEEVEEVVPAPSPVEE